ncbi:MAG: XTP/dITP diphosphatase [Clostridiales bacterium]
MQEIFFATSNENKAEELKNLTSELNIKILTMKDFPKFVQPEETGTTFQENALIKAEAASKFSGLPALADDSGLTVDALDGAPGIYSARYSGEDATDQTNNEKLLKALESVDWNHRQGQFHTFLALFLPNGETFFTEGIADGLILTEYRGDQGFGYDPLFYVPFLDRTMAEISLGEKNKISHRAKAFKKMLKYLKTMS